MLIIPGYIRFIALVLLISWVLLTEWKKPPDQRQRLADYQFLLSVDLMGALLGITSDWITSSLAPAYFQYFKGIDPGPHFKLDSS